MRLGVSMLSVAVGLSIMVAVSQAAPVGSGFTYQGQLKFEGKPVTDTVDVLFTLYDADVAGNGIGSTLVFDGQTGDPVPIDVVNGLFSASLDFGVGSFNGQARWLQVEVRSPHDPTDTAPFTPLNPRQEITPTPFSLETRGINVDADGNVGVGTPAPSSRLDVIGSADIEGESNVVARFRAVDSDLSDAGVLIGSLNGNTPFISDASGGGTSLGLSFRTSNSERMRITAAGKVGIGTTMPSTRLDIELQGHQFGVTPSLRLGQSTAGAITQDALSGTAVEFFGDDRVWAMMTGGTRGLTTGREGFLSLSTRDARSAAGVMAERMRITGEGNVGIGTTTPGAKLDVQSDDVETNILIGTTAPGGRRWNILSSATGSPAGAGKFVIEDETSGGFGRLFITDIGNVGIGTPTPKAKLHIGGHVAGAFRPWMDNGVIVGNDSDGGYFGVKDEGPNRQDTVIAWGDDSDDALRFINTLANGVTTEAMRISANGNVGIGTTNPHQALDVNGHIRTKVIEITGGADLAEPFDVSSEERSKASIVPGVVVCIDPQHPGDLRLCDSPYDGTVAGVISGANGIAPGMVMKASGRAHVDGKHPVALTGRVYCWCDAESNGPIDPGDMLTTSAIPGRAMKATDRDRAYGTVIGKAMTSLTAGHGLVLVLVALQ